MRQIGPGVGVSFKWETRDSGPKPGLRGIQTPTSHLCSAYRWLGHETGSRQPLLSIRPADTFPTTKHHRSLTSTKTCCLVTEERVWTTCPESLRESLMARSQTHNLSIVGSMFQNIHTHFHYEGYKHSKASVPWHHASAITAFKHLWLTTLTSDLWPLTSDL